MEVPWIPWSCTYIDNDVSKSFCLIGVISYDAQISNSSSSYRFICLISCFFVSFMLFFWVMWAISVAKYLGFIKLVIMDTATFLFVYCDKISIFVCFLQFCLDKLAVFDVLLIEVSKSLHY